VYLPRTDCVYLRLKTPKVFYSCGGESFVQARTACRPWLLLSAVLTVSLQLHAAVDREESVARIVFSVWLLGSRTCFSNNDISVTLMTHVLQVDVLAPTCPQAIDKEHPPFYSCYGTRNIVEWLPLLYRMWEDRVRNPASNIGILTDTFHDFRQFFQTKARIMIKLFIFFINDMK
jgi:hypothetical protein